MKILVCISCVPDTTSKINFINDNKEFSKDGVQYVINKNAPNCEIWMSSPLSGASHYYLENDLATWVDTRSGHKLFEKLEQELSQSAGKSFTF